MNWHTRQMRQSAREREAEFMRPKSNKPKLKVPKDFTCWNCIQKIGSSACKRGSKGEPCSEWVRLNEMAKRGELEYE